MKQIILASLFFSILLLTNCSHLHQQNSSISEEFKGISEDSLVKIACSLDIMKHNILSIEVPSFNYSTRVIGSIDELFDSLQVIFLETTDYSTIGDITQIEILNDTIYVRDQYLTKKIYTFNIEGNFIKIIGSMGQGPFEYTEPSDMHVTKDAIIVYDQWQHKLIKFAHNGDQIFEKKLPFTCNMAIELSDNSYLFHGINSDNTHLPSILNYQFWHCDSSMKIDKVGQYREFKKYDSFWANQYLIRNANEILFYNDINDTIYQIESNGNIYPIYKLFFKSNHSIDRKLSGDKRGFIKSSNNGEYISLNNFQIVGDNIIYSLHTGHRATIVSQNIHTKHVKYYNATDIKKSNLSRLIHFYNPIGKYNNYIVFKVPISTIKEQYKYAEDHPQWWEDAPYNVLQFDKNIHINTSEDSNDVIVLARIKTL